LNLLTQSAVRDAVSSVQSLSGTTTSPAVNFCTFTVLAAGQTVTIQSVSTIVGTGSMDLFIFSLPVTVLTAAQREKADVDMLNKRADAQDKKIEELVRMLTHCNSPTPESESGVVIGESSSSPPMSSSIHIPRGLLDKYLKA